MELINTLVNFFFDQKAKNLHKGLIMLSALVLLIIIDNTLNFTQHYNNSRKFEQITSINTIIEHASITEKERKELIRKRWDIFEKKSWRDEIYDYLKINLKPYKGSDPVEVPAKPHIEDKNLDENNSLLHFFTSGWIFLVGIIVMPVFAFKNSTNSVATNVIIWVIVVIPLMLGCAWLLAKAFSYIPVFGPRWINYLLNFILAPTSVMLIGKALGVNDNSKKSS